MTERRSMSELVPIIVEAISGGGEFCLYPRGTSMLPLLREGKDAVILVSPAIGSVRKNDIILYRRKNGKWVLHRIVKIKNNEIFLCGDNQGTIERGIYPPDVAATVCAVMRDGKRINVSDKKYLSYVKRINATRPLRALRSKLSGIIHKGKKGTVN